MLTPLLHRKIAGAISALLLTAVPVAAQLPVLSRPHVRQVVTVTGDSADRLRLGNLAGTNDSTSQLLRSGSQLMRAVMGGSQLELFAPFVTVRENSALPYGENDGALWAGKGPNVRAIAGIGLTARNVRLILLPEAVYSANEFFEYTQFIKPRLPSSRNPYSSPWNIYPYSIDAPPRFGPSHVRRIAPGQSSLTLTYRNIEFGATTENEWWGPGIRSAIVLSDNAEGFPRAFIRPVAPRQTRIGKFDFRVTWGGLQESPFFDFSSSNDLRYWSAAAITWNSALEPGLTLGAARAVYGAVDGWSGVVGKPLHFLKRTSPHYDSVANRSDKSEQILSFFGRWVFPTTGFEAYGEWARTEFPRSLRDILEQPGHSQGYTFGVQWLGARNAIARVRVQAEHSYLERGPSFRTRPTSSFYSSPVVTQGYTSRGQVIGAGMGQGSSGEWMALDFVRPSASVGAFLFRTRFNNDAYFLAGFPYSRGNCQHDVTAGPGARATWRSAYGALSVEYSNVERMNAFFQNASECQDFQSVVDVWNKSLKLSFTLGR